VQRKEESEPIRPSTAPEAAPCRVKPDAAFVSADADIVKIESRHQLEVRLEEFYREVGSPAIMLC
jgi:hypothetical protein